MGNEPAFPVEHASSGLTKREYIAAQIAAGMLAANPPFKCWEDCADAAVHCADALLKRLALG